MKRRLRVPSPAFVISLIALAVALGGTSYAAITLPKNVVGTMQLKKNAVTSPKVKNNAITGADVNESTLGQVPSATNATNATNATSAANATNATNATHATSADNATVASTLPALIWSSLSLQNSWANYPGAVYGPPGLQYTKDHEGFVHLRGALTGLSATNNLVATLPSGFRPPSGAWVAVGESNGSFNPFPENAWIESSGNIRLLPGTGANNAFVSFEGVEFYAG